MKALTRTEVHVLVEKIMDAEDVYLERDSGDSMKLSHGLFSRLSEAEKQLRFLLDHTTKESRIKLPSSVVAACYDAYIELQK